MVACAATLVYLVTLRNGFALDDVPLVRDNPDIRSVAGIPRLFTLPYWNTGEHAGAYRPVTMASFALQRAVLGASPAGFHLVNVLLHALVSALVWLAARRAGAYYGTAMLTGLLFAVHPVHAEAVANVAGRAELLAAAGVLGAWIAHRRKRWGAAALLYLGAVLSKESAVLAPVLFLADDLLIAREDRSARRGGAWPAYVAYGGGFAVAIALRVAALGGPGAAEATIFLDNPAAFEGSFARIATGLWTLALHLKLFVWPARLVSDYSFDAIPVVRTASDARFWAGSALAIACAVTLRSCWRGGRRTAFLALAGALLFVLPASNLLFPSGTIFAERLAYLPSFGLCLLLGHLAAGFASKGFWPRDTRVRAIGVVVAAAVALVALSARAALRGADWKDNLTLSLADAASQPRSAKLHAGAGIALEAAGRDAEAERSLRRAVTLWPDYAQARFNLALLLSRRGARDEAIVELRAAVATGTRNPRPWDALVALLAESGRTEEALAVCARAYDVVHDDAGVARRCSELARGFPNRHNDRR